MQEGLRRELGEYQAEVHRLREATSALQAQRAREDDLTQQLDEAKGQAGLCQMVNLCLAELVERPSAVDCRSEGSADYNLESSNGPEHDQTDLNLELQEEVSRLHRKLDDLERERLRREAVLQVHAVRAMSATIARIDQKNKRHCLFNWALNAKQIDERVHEWHNQSMLDELRRAKAGGAEAKIRILG